MHIVDAFAIEGGGCDTASGEHQAIKMKPDVSEVSEKKQLIFSWYQMNV
jgi:hypothetical protein